MAFAYFVRSNIYRKHLKNLPLAPGKFWAAHFIQRILLGAWILGNAPHYQPNTSGTAAAPRSG
jgi:hypothetical protein